MLISLCFLLLFQDHNHAEHGENGVSFTPISSGNVVTLGDYSLTIPEGTLYADENNVQYMFSLAGAVDIPNAVGMFASSSGTWDYSVTVQHIDSENFKFTPIPPMVYQLFFGQNDLLTLYPVEGIANVLFEPELDFDQQSVQVAMQYVYKDGKVVNAMKKVWVTATEALILTLNSNEAGFDGDFEQISKIFTSVAIKPEALKAEPGPDPIPSYSLLGMKPNFEINPEALNSGAEEEPEPISLVPSLILISFAGILLFVAMKLRGRKKETTSVE